MTQAGTGALNALLFGGDIRVANIKFLPGTDIDLTADRMCEAARAAIEAARSGDLVSRFPETSRGKSPL